MIKGEEIRETGVEELALTSYFSSEACEYLFYLLELDGEVRMTKLGITRTLFMKKEAAKKWYRQIAKLIHPDHCTHPNATRGMDVLNDLYTQMIEG